MRSDPVPVDTALQVYKVPGDVIVRNKLRAAEVCRWRMSRPGHAWRRCGWTSTRRLCLI